VSGVLTTATVDETGKGQRSREQGERQKLGADQLKSQGVCDPELPAQRRGFLCPTHAVPIEASLEAGAPEQEKSGAEATQSTETEAVVDLRGCVPEKVKEQQQ
jgi:hypothetical protein